MEEVFRQLSFGVHFRTHPPEFDALLKKQPVEVSADATSGTAPMIVPEEDIFAGAEASGATKSEVKTPKLPARPALGLDSSEIGSLRKRQKIHVAGSDVPPPLTSFQDLTNLEVPPFLLKVLNENHFAEPTPIQMQVIPVLMKSRELLATAPTGSGKTAAFLIPVLAKLASEHHGAGLRAVILVPTRELSEQCYRVARVLREGSGLHINLLSRASMGSIARDFSKTDVLISTPERVVALLKDHPDCLKGLKFMVFDEADKLFDVAFIEQVDQIVGASPKTGIVRALFGATMPPSIEELARSVLLDPIRVSIGARGTATSLVSQRLVYCGNEEGKLIALRQHLSGGEEALLPPVVVFVQSKERAEELYAALQEQQQKVAVIHSGLNHAQREAALNSIRTGESWVLVATDLVARGMDIRSINGVINYDFPQTVHEYTVHEDVHRFGLFLLLILSLFDGVDVTQTVHEYVHRFGALLTSCLSEHLPRRAGRRRAGVALTYFTQEDSPALRSIASAMEQAGCEVPAWMLSMPKLSKSDRHKLKAKPVSRESIAHVSHVKVPFKRRVKVLGAKMGPQPDRKKEGQEAESERDEEGGDMEKEEEEEEEGRATGAKHARQQVEVERDDADDAPAAPAPAAGPKRLSNPAMHATRMINKAAEGRAPAEEAPRKRVRQETPADDESEIEDDMTGGDADEDGAAEDGERPPKNGPRRGGASRGLIGWLVFVGCPTVTFTKS
ncbi:putative DEAD-box ATP-dependent RNA helicase 57 [Paratrimastix pyriformis]|uniref:RNA helicase n=1 Tax=Paratrimastix pyriformis TaxID=342808 RepID=A0ABQ8U823_9EUKA|nr:putative DEAD-box ATP-dependent RNA helicase 57 [Paratrimastix pyriformis]